MVEGIKILLGPFLNILTKILLRHTLSGFNTFLYNRAMQLRRWTRKTLFSHHGRIFLPFPFLGFAVLLRYSFALYLLNSPQTETSRKTYYMRKTDSFNPLIANPTKWSTHSRKFVGWCQRIVLSMFDHLWGWHLKG